MAAHESYKISDYALIGNGRTAALVSRFGSIDWCCFPRFDSESYFAALLDPKRGGSFVLRPDIPYRSEFKYIRDTNIVETTYYTERGQARVRDFFSVSSETEKKKRLIPDHEILRIIDQASGEIPFVMLYSPRPDYGRKSLHLNQRGKLGLVCATGLSSLSLRTDGPEIMLGLDSSSSKAVSRFSVNPGGCVNFSLSYDELAPAVYPPLGPFAEERFNETFSYWKGWVSQCQYQGVAEAEVRRSALTLKLLMYAPSGAIVAAPTTSLPEWIGGNRNWDYRYCWLRDASFTVRALLELGFMDEAHAFVSWMIYATRLTWPKLQILYSVHGESNLPERTLEWLSGYRNSKPVRVGNAAEQQLQIDVYGEVLDAFHAISPHVADTDSETRKFLLGLGTSVCELLDSPDDGIWEVRSGRAHHTHSKVLAWTALDRLVKICKRYGWSAPTEEYLRAADKVRSEIESQAFNPQLGAYASTLGGDKLDASILVMPLVGYCAGDSERMVSTIDTIKKNLSKKDLIYRYRSVDDGLPGDEGTFGICSFWMIEALAKAGRIKEAQEWFDAFLKRQNSVGLWPEEIDPNTGEFLGNYPQAFTHIGLINAAITLTKYRNKEVAA